jgi:hypothetical protein
MQTRCDKVLSVGVGGSLKAVFRVLKTIDIAGKARPFPIYRDATRDIAVWAPPRRKDA